MMVYVKTKYLVSLLIILSATLSSCYYFDDNVPRYLTAAVSDSVVYDCEIDFPQGFPIPYMLEWKRQVRSKRNSNKKTLKK